MNYWLDGYYIGTVSGRGNRKIIESYIRNQGREEDIKQHSCLSMGYITKV